MFLTSPRSEVSTQVILVIFLSSLISKDKENTYLFFPVIAVSKTKDFFMRDSNISKAFILVTSLKVVIVFLI